MRVGGKSGIGKMGMAKKDKYRIVERCYEYIYMKNANNSSAQGLRGEMKTAGNGCG